MNFTRKGYGRIFVKKAEDAELVRTIVREMDEFELEYMPKDIVAPFSEYPQLTYLHKFCDLDIHELTARCWERGVWIFCVDNGYSCTMKRKVMAYEITLGVSKT